MAAINDRVDPPIRVCSVITTKLTRFSVNNYEDPEDGCCFDPNDLTALERGHVYLWKELRTPEEICVHTPYRVMDAEQAELLKGLSSFKALPPYITGSVIPERRKKDKRFCLSDFKLSDSDFSEFRRRVIASGGVVEKDEVDIAMFFKKIDNLKEVVRDLAKDAADFREDNCLLTGLDNLKTERELTTCMADIDFFEKREKQINEAYADIAKDYAKLSTDIHRSKSDMAVADSKMESIRTTKESLLPLNIERMTRELIHKNKVQTGNSSGKPEYIKNLHSEIQELSHHYPILKFFDFSGEDSRGNAKVEIKISGITIKISDEGNTVKIDGDLTSLKPYLSGVTSEGNSHQKRRRTIFSGKDET